MTQSSSNTTRIPFGIDFFTLCYIRRICEQPSAFS
jgi:hypothetical protein